jgi:predicted  nucleic acid-binding Zn ribbon protein
LFTHAFTEESPVCCGDTGRPIPAYLLPVSDQTRRGLYGWAGRYSHHDNIFLDCAALEIAAYKQMADPTSRLSVESRKLCADVEKATGKPTFYYLMRYWGRSSGEEKRLCPLCGRKWRVSCDAGAPRETEGKKPFWQFAFRCVRCRLVSHLADCDDNQRYARIGEYRGK